MKGKKKKPKSSGGKVEEKYSLSANGLIRILNDLKSSDPTIKREIARILIDLAKNGENISPTFPSLNKVLSDKDEEVRLLVAEAFKFYYSNYISYYCRLYSYDDFSKNINDLKSPKKEEQVRALNRLNSYTQWADKGIGWRYLHQKTIDKLISDLKSSDPAIRKKSARTLRDAVKNSMNIFDAVPALKTTLYDKDSEVRWLAAEALAHYYGMYTNTTYGYYSGNIDRLKSPNVKDKISAANFLASLTTPDLVSDRDERDISFTIPLLTLLLFDKNIKAKKAALTAIRNAQSEGQMITDAIPAVFEMISDKNKKIQDIAIFIFRDLVSSEFDISNYINDLTKLLSINWGVADVLTLYYANQQNWKEIEKLLNHSDKDVRQETVGTLNHVKWSLDISPIFPALKKLLSDPDKEVKFVAARTLVDRTKDTKSLSATVPIFTTALSDSEKKMRLNAAFNLKKVAEKGVDISEAVDELKTTSKEKNDQIRNLSLDALKIFKKKRKKAKVKKKKSKKRVRKRSYDWK
ncbi:MAG: hypothetical protein HWN67_00930 [Candidatus Helarchaeota archaeon]|nr:hypothetical protein [Candidatus Helarchaeota archaeon]